MATSQVEFDNIHRVGVAWIRKNSITVLGFGKCIQASYYRRPRRSIKTLQRQQFANALILDNGIMLPTTECFWAPQTKFIKMIRWLLSHGFPVSFADKDLKALIAQTYPAAETQTSKQKTQDIFF